jgi:hypothetical protein
MWNVIVRPVPELYGEEDQEGEEEEGDVLIA